MESFKNCSDYYNSNSDILFLKETFHKKFPDYNVDELKLLNVSETSLDYVFSIHDVPIGLTIEDNGTEGEEPIEELEIDWYKNNKIFLSTQKSTYPSDRFKCFKLFDQSCDYISYYIYTHDQCMYIPTEFFFTEKTEKKLELITCETVNNPYCDYTYDYYVKWNDMCLYMGDYYFITKNDKILSGFYSNNSCYVGDCDTDIYLTNKGNIHICNCGDVSSDVIIMFN